MFKNQIFELTKPGVNTYQDDRDRFSKKFVLITEDTSGFESIIKEMNDSQISIEKVKIVKCDNPNCKTAFSQYHNCLSCKRVFCESCLLTCDNCAIKCCKFCLRIDYSKFKDIQICPNC